MSEPRRDVDHGSRVGFRLSDDYADRNPGADPIATELAINVLYTAELLGRRVDQALRPFGLARGSHNVLQVLGGAAEPLRPPVRLRPDSWSWAPR